MYEYYYLSSIFGIRVYENCTHVLPDVTICLDFDEFFLNVAFPSLCENYCPYCSYQRRIHDSVLELPNSGEVVASWYMLPSPSTTCIVAYVFLLVNGFVSSLSESFGSP